MAGSRLVKRGSASVGGGGGGSSAGSELSYVERTTALSPTAATEATAETFVTAAAVVFDGTTRVKIECFSPYWRPAATASQVIVAYLFDGETSLGTIAYSSTPAAAVNYQPLNASCFLTPSAASHTYSIRISVSSGTGVVAGGPGGAAADVPAYIRITTAPQ